MKTNAIRKLVFALGVVSLGPGLNFAAQQQPAGQPAPAPQTRTADASTTDASTTDPQRPALRQRYPRYRIR